MSRTGCGRISGTRGDAVGFGAARGRGSAVRTVRVGGRVGGTLEERRGRRILPFSRSTSRRTTFIRSRRLARLASCGPALLATAFHSLSQAHAAGPTLPTPESTEATVPAERPSAVVGECSGARERMERSDGCAGAVAGADWRRFPAD